MTPPPPPAAPPPPSLVTDDTDHHHLSPHSTHDYASDPAWLHSIDAVYRLFEDPELRQTYPQLAPRVRHAVTLCEQVLKEFDDDEWALSFNGGKDCTVLVHIICAVLRRLSGRSRRGQYPAADVQVAAAAPSNNLGAPAAPAPPPQGSTHPTQTLSARPPGPPPPHPPPPTHVNDASPPPPCSSPSPPLPTHASRSSLPPIPALYVSCASPFAEMERFVRESIGRYALRLVEVRADMKRGLEAYLEGGGETWSSPSSSSSSGRDEGRDENDDGQRDSPRTSLRNGQAAASNGVAGAAGAGEAVASSPTHRRRRNVKAIFVGTRRGDPHGSKLRDRQRTDPGWPQVERVHPVLDWSYEDVWAFLRCEALAYLAPPAPPEHDDGGQGGASGGRRGSETGRQDVGGEAQGGTAFVGVPYCVLYDRGYTSLGSTHNTFPNPQLLVPRRERGGEREEYLPAYLLRDEAMERAGRGSSSSSSSLAKPFSTQA